MMALAMGAAVRCRLAVFDYHRNGNFGLFNRGKSNKERVVAQAFTQGRRIVLGILGNTDHLGRACFACDVKGFVLI